ncbi:MAG: hypothetical protein ACRBDL_08080 [Alphaproteobacteria bacterium]
MSHFESICEITGIMRKSDESYGSYANSTFISPSHILTAWHNLSGIVKNELAFTNCHGDHARMKEGGLKIRSTSSDLAIVELDQPIGEDLYTRPINNNLLPDDGVGRLFALHATGQRAVEMRVAPIHDLGGLKDSVPEGHIVFDCPNKQVRLGHSGAPVVNESGFIVSVLSSAAFYKASHAPDAEFETSARTFMGPSPEKVSDFVEDFLFRL